MVFFYIKYMDEAKQYGQQDFNLPHDVVTLTIAG